MTIRRVIPGTNSQGKSVFVGAGDAPAQHDYVHIPGMTSVQLWSTPADPVIPKVPADPVAEVKSVMPAPGGTQFMVVTFPPETVFMTPAFDPVAAHQENLRVSPGLAECFEADNPGMHTTETIDYGIVLDGEIWLELDDAQTQHLRKHDVIVQNGTRHAWRNRGTVAAVMAFVLIGARR